MNRIDRLTAILIHLQSKQRVPIHELEERFDVSGRTIFRDIRSLIESGVPIGGDAGTGYFIVDGYHLPPVVFSKEEASAILLGAKFIEKNADSQISRHFEEAMFKIKAVIHYHDKVFLENLENSVTVVGSPALNKRGFPESHISEIQQALASRKVVRISYYSQYKEQHTMREVEPLGLVYYGSRWHLMGYCRLRQDLRDFRTDRIKNIVLLNETFDPSSHPNFEAFTYGMTSGTDALEATVVFTKKASRFIQEQKYFYGFVSEKIMGEHVEIKFLVPRYEYLARWLMMFGDQVQVVGPPELKELMVTTAEEALTHHQKFLKKEKIQ